MGFLTKYLKAYLLAILILAVLVITGCSQDGNDDDDDDSSGSETVSITGTWIASRDGTDCTETDIFNADGTFSIFGNEELIGGNYTFKETASSGARHPLSIMITSDNLQPDCEGVAEDDTGLSVTLYLEFSNDGNRFTVYPEATGEDVWFSAIRQ